MPSTPYIPPGIAQGSAGDITGVTAGTGLSGGGSSGGVTLTLDLSELSAVTPVNGDSLATLDSDGANEQLTTVAALATLFAGTGLTASNSVIGVDASQTQITAVGTIATGTWEGTTIAVDQGGTGATTLNNLITLSTHTTGNYVATITGGTGITSTGATSGEGIAHSLSVDAAQTGITSILATDVKIGEDDQTKIDFEDANAINFYANNAKEVVLVENSLSPGTASGTDLGTTSAEWGNIYVGDDKKIYLGDGQDVSLEYDEDGTDQLRVSGKTVFDNDIEIADSKFIEFASAAGTPTTDNTVQGIVIEFLAAEAITQFDAVYVSTTTGRVGRADANDNAKLPAIGIAIEAQGSAGSSVRVLTHGVYRDDGGFGGNMTVGADLYVSETPGTLTTTAPGDDGDFLQFMGVAVGVRSAFINPDLTIIEHD